MILDKVYCFWDAQTLVDTCLMIFNTCSAGLLLFLVIRTYLKAKKVLIRGVLKFYYLMMCWGVLFIGKNIFSIVVFFKDYWGDRWSISEDWMNTRITENSKIYQFVDALPAVVVQTLLLLIPLHILGNMLVYNFTKDKKLKKLHQIGNVYFWARLIILGLSITIFAIDNSQLTTIEILSQVKILLLVIDGLIGLFYLVVVRGKQMKKKNLEQDQSLNSELDVEESLKKQLSILILAAISRFTINFLNFAVVPYIYNFTSYKNTCFYGLAIYDGDMFYTISYIILGDNLMHFLPILLICIMYQPPAL